MGVSAAVYAAKGIIQSSIATAVADCNAPHWPVSHYIVPVKNQPPCNVAFRQNSTDYSDAVAKTLKERFK